MNDDPFLSSPAGEAVEAEALDRALKSLRAGKPLRLRLPGGGELNIDRPLPFIFAYDPPGRQSDPWTSRLLKAEASTWFPSHTLTRKEMRAVLVPVLRALVDDYGALLVIEVRARSRASAAEENRFQLGEHPLSPDTEVLETLAEGLGKIKVRQRDSVVERKRTRTAPGHFVATVGRKTLEDLGVSVIQLGVPPVYRDEEENLFPLLLRALRKQLVRELRRTAHRFAELRANRSPPTYLALGKRRLVRSVLEVDRRLDELASSFDYLMLITPTNVQESWEKFQADGFKVAPRFRYRPIPLDPGLQKRRLYELPIEKIADPALAQIFEDRRYEFDVRLAMLQQRGGRKHLLAGLQLYGEIDARTLGEAEQILAIPLPPGAAPDDVGGVDAVDAETFAKRTREEFRNYRKQDREFHSDVKVRKDLGSVLVSRGKVYVDRYLKISRDRLEALIAHEVGTHVLTFHNGGSQPLHIFSTGLAGYEELQEGLAVLAEHLVGGLTLPRMRLIAGRVLAARSKLQDATFVETFALLHERYGFSPRSAFLTTMRAYRGGGSLKDVIYLRGVSRLLEHLRAGGDLDILFLGKIAQRHVPLVKELLEREILRAPALIPGYRSDTMAKERLARVRRGLTIPDLISPPAESLPPMPKETR